MTRLHRTGRGWRVTPCTSSSCRSAHTLPASISSLATKRIQLTTDGYKPYPKAVYRAFGDNIDYATLVKVFGTDEEPRIDTRAVIGDPDPQFINTSYVESSNLALRMGIKRFTRKTNAFSKRVDSHKNSVALYFLYHNFCWAHGGLNGKTPAQAIGLAEKKYDTKWIVGLIDERVLKPNRPKIYKKREVPTVDPSTIGVPQHVGSCGRKLNLRM